MFALVFVSPPQAGQCSQGGLVCPSWFASCLGEGGGGERGAGVDNRIYNSFGGREKRGMAIF